MMGSSCWIGLGALWRSLCRRLRAIKTDAEHAPRGGKLPHGPETDALRRLRDGGGARPDASQVKPNVDYSRFELLAKEQDEGEGSKISVALCGRQGWNSQAVNGIYMEDGTLNGRVRLRKSDGSRWLKFTDDSKWMVSRYPDGRPLGEAFAAEDPEDPRAIAGPWYVCSEEQTWEEDYLVSVTPGACSGCGKPLQRIHRCSQCRAVSYCDSKCQKADWYFHKRRCRPAELPLDRTSTADAVKAAAPKESEELATMMRKESARATPTPSRERTKPMALKNQPSDSKPRAGRNWEEIDLLPWSRQTLKRLLDGAAAREGLPPLRVDFEDAGHVEVSGVQEIDGLASLWPNQGERRHLFDLSFEVVFKAVWPSDFSMMSMEGSVFLHDFTSNLVDDPEAVCGMSVKFAAQSESCLDGPRKAMQSTVLPTSRALILEALGADAWSIARGEGLMHLVHLRLRRFAQDFEAK
ncbi:unnamed protein product [Durusdinium trenchii]|uniref:MYND-type domain-containing protein n=2 Tax=Durusdinium trenchii TaxID=1381693 RepID=A0ABP0KVX8_9DINO